MSESKADPITSTIAVKVQHDPSVTARDLAIFIENTVGDLEEVDTVDATPKAAR